MRLPSYLLQYCSPDITRNIHAFLLRDNNRNGNVDKAIMLETDLHTSLARHGGMDRMASHAVAQIAVRDIGGYASNVIAGIEILKLDRLSDRCKMLADFCP